jgi:hypothetical protein
MFGKFSVHADAFALWIHWLDPLYFFDGHWCFERLVLLPSIK